MQERQYNRFPAANANLCTASSQESRTTPSKQQTMHESPVDSQGESDAEDAWRFHVFFRRSLIFSCGDPTLFSVESSRLFEVRKSMPSSSNSLVRSLARILARNLASSFLRERRASFCHSHAKRVPSTCAARKARYGKMTMRRRHCATISTVGEGAAIWERGFCFMPVAGLARLRPRASCENAGRNPSYSMRIPT